MKREERITEICKQCNDMLGESLANAIAHAISEGYKLGLEEIRNQIIDEVCNWIYQHKEAYLFTNHEGTWFDSNLLISELKKAMTE